MKKLKTIGKILLVLLLLAQFFRIDKTNPNSDPSKDVLNMHNANADIKSTLQSACYDCHSYKTKYPWYSNIAPVSWMLAHHVKEGREHLNFSLWGDLSDKKKANKKEDILDALENGWMPLSGYKMMHSKANLSEDQKKKLIEFFESI